MTAPVAFPKVAYQALLRRVPSPSQKVMGHLLPIFENSYSHTKFLQDTLMNYVPKMLVVRSLPEANEITFLEFLESGLLYYGISGMGEHVFRPLFTSMSPNKINPKLLTSALENIPKAKLQSVVPIKAAFILSSLGVVAIAGQYALHFAKNLMTQKLFKKSRFSDVVSLTKGTKPARKEDNVVREKAQKRIATCIGIASAFIAASTLIARFGGKNPVVLNGLKKFVEKFDFRYNHKGNFDLSRWAFAVYAAINFAGYVDAARDKLERIEVAARVGTVIAFLFYGQEFIQKAMLKGVARTCPDILSPKGGLKSVTQITLEANKLAQTQPAKAVQYFNKTLKAKNKLFFLPLLISVTIPGLGVSLFSRFWTAYRFNVQAQEALVKLRQHKQKEASSTPQPFMPFSQTPTAVPMPNRYSTASFQAYQQPSA